MKKNEALKPFYAFCQSETYKGVKIDNGNKDVKVCVGGNEQNTLPVLRDKQRSPQDKGRYKNPSRREDKQGLGRPVALSVVRRPRWMGL